MERYEYKVVPAPEKAPKIRGLQGPARFAHTMESLMNDMGRDGWSYIRADTLPVEERSGFTSRQTHYRNMLIFQRKVAAEPIVATPVIVHAVPQAAPLEGGASTPDHPMRPMRPAAE